MSVLLPFQWVQTVTLRWKAPAAWVAAVSESYWLFEVVVLTWNSVPTMDGTSRPSRVSSPRQTDLRGREADGAPAQGAEADRQQQRHHRRAGHQGDRQAQRGEQRATKEHQAPAVVDGETAPVQVQGQEAGTQGAGVGADVIDRGEQADRLLAVA